MSSCHRDASHVNIQPVCLSAHSSSFNGINYLFPGWRFQTCLLCVTSSPLNDKSCLRLTAEEEVGWAFQTSETHAETHLPRTHMCGDRTASFKTGSVLQADCMCTISSRVRKLTGTGDLWAELHAKNTPAHMYNKAGPQTHIQSCPSPLEKRRG